MIGASVYLQGTSLGAASNVDGDYLLKNIPAGHGAKVETSTLNLHPQTNVKIYNNTLVDNGYRRGAAEPGAGVYMETFSRGEVYNNLFVSDYNGLKFNPSADTANIKYGNNYFYTTVDSTRQYYYSSASFRKQQPSDIISTGVNDKKPMFKTFTKDPLAATDNNDYHLQPGSPAIGAGNPKYNNDIGAYTSDGKGNKH